MTSTGLSASSPLAQTAITIRQTAVTVYFRSTQLLLFAFARQRIGADNYPANKKHVYNIYTTSAQRLQRWSNIV